MHTHAHTLSTINKANHPPSPKESDNQQINSNQQEISYNLLSDKDSPAHMRVKQKTNIPYEVFKIPTILNGKIVKCEVKKHEEQKTK